ncbi:Ethanolamine ammonia-lyase light chain [Poseidonocella pacifica]|uniref:Ethanolamine ammonia-lyase small subunit n=1 Tax=Poseidonocella pacifica TaxID=871651 RepID=A0A1I0Y0S9_9RHOB|nr:ethanolamine ammonia-lyase subunit EutC [Poseidonocella pacifica]SFB06969.1 Ethanolamine ammonia-lyase light chain [Poseidonocella pacifica]
MSDEVARDPFARLRAATPARIGLGRSGAALTTATSLEFQYAHARARDAVHRPLDIPGLKAALAPLETVDVQSAAPDRQTYLRRPDLGRQLGSGVVLDSMEGCDVALIIADGLSADAVQSHAAPVLHALCPRLMGLRLSPVVIATQARVALGDAIAERFGARLSIVLVGERPGLTVADSLGAYITFAPGRGVRDSARNCISNIHGQGGLTHDLAAHKIAWITREALRLQLTGTGLKEEASALPGPNPDALPS